MLNFKIEFQKNENKMLLRELRMLKDETVKYNNENKILNINISKLNKKVKRKLNSH